MESLPGLLQNCPSNTKKTDKPTEIYQGIGSDTEDTEYDPFDDETLLAPQTLTAEEEYEFIDPGFVSDLEEKSHLGNEDVTLGAATSADDPRGLPLILGASASLPESINMMTNVAVGMMPHIPGDEAYESEDEPAHVSNESEDASRLLAAEEGQRDPYM